MVMGDGRWWLMEVVLVMESGVGSLMRMMAEGKLGV